VRRRGARRLELPLCVRDLGSLNPLWIGSAGSGDPEVLELETAARCYPAATGTRNRRRVREFSAVVCWVVQARSSLQVRPGGVAVVVAEQRLSSARSGPNRHSSTASRDDHARHVRSMIAGIGTLKRPDLAEDQRCSATTTATPAGPNLKRASGPGHQHTTAEIFELGGLFRVPVAPVGNGAAVLEFGTSGSPEPCAPIPGAG